MIGVETAEALRLLSFVDTRQGWMVGFGSDVYHTKDGGDNWEKQLTPARVKLNAVYFVDSEHGWAVGDRGTVLQTSDGGKRWSLRPRRPTKVDLLDVFFYDSSHGWAVGDLSTFVKTIDGGVTWQVSQIDPSYGALTGVSFDLDTDGKPNYGLVVSAGGGFFRTSDGGKTWAVRSFQTATPLYGVVAVNPLSWPEPPWSNFAAGPDGSFVPCGYKNYDLAILEGHPNFKALDFIDDKLGWLVGEAGSIRKTSNAGKTWKLQDVRHFNLEAVKCTDSNHAWALSEAIEHGRILFITTDGGTTWNERLVPASEPSGGINPNVPATETDSAFRVFVPKRHPISNDLILPDTQPLIEETSTQMSISACRGEYEPATFAVRSSVALTNVHVQAADLHELDDAGQVIFADAIDVKWIKCWYQTHRNFKSPAAVLMPELLLNNDGMVSVGSPGELPPMQTREWADSTNLQPLNLEAEFTKQVWLTVHVPEDAQPGQYAGKITVTAERQRPRTLELRVRVLPFVLEDPLLDYAMFVNSEIHSEGGSLCGSWYRRSPAQVRSLLADLKAHGITHPFVAQPITLVPAPTPPGDWALVKYDPTCLGQYLEILDELGFAKDKLFYGNLYMKGHINYAKHEKVGDPDVKKWPPEAFMPTVHIVTSLAKKFGYREVYFYGMDEVSGQQLEFQKPLFEMMRRVKTPVPAKTYGAAGMPSDAYDITTCGTFPALKDIKQYQATGRLVYMYSNPIAGRGRAYTFRRNVGLLLYKLGVDGAGWWADYSYIRGAFDDCFVYYTKNGQLDTLQWEGWREGVDDVRYLTTLHKAIKAAIGGQKCFPAAAKAEAWLKNLKITDGAQELRQEAIAHIMALQGR